MKNWKEEIATAYLVKQHLARADARGMWRHCLPNVAASQEAVLIAEKRLGSDLDPKYREFLLFANGWEAFFHSIDLFGIDDLLGGDRLARARELLRSLEPLYEVSGIRTEDAVPIAVSTDSIDVFIIDCSISPGSGRVIWLAGQVIDIFADFDEFFLAMVDYNRDEIRALMVE